jgi:hypothetical protein
MHETKSTLLAFDQYLAERRLQFDAVVIGGAALNLLGVVVSLDEGLRHSASGNPERDCRGDPGQGRHAAR